ncbi:MAG: hypothetical protein CRU78_16980 [Candidatus Accumulibacter phosphatis]|uniref:AlpA family phage regulatory protein n=1 Tax=Candidatus Accumulibacter phosphatis TaxID=327160 RepID=A0A6A7RXB6_9PROT|nr:hypothetical protein [Candidatus Accumulibacter phosphatis]
MATELRFFLRLEQVKSATGMSRSWIYDAINRGRFPAPISLGARAVAWDSADIAAWQAGCIERGSSAHAVRSSGLASGAVEPNPKTTKVGRRFQRSRTVLAEGEAS